MNISPLGPIRDIAAVVRDELRERREARDAHAALQRELASYQTPDEIDDLLGVIKDADGPEAQQIRDILMDNLRPTKRLYRAA